MPSDETANSNDKTKRNNESNLSKPSLQSIDNSLYGKHTQFLNMQLLTKKRKTPVIPVQSIQEDARPLTPLETEIMSRRGYLQPFSPYISK